MVDLAIFLVQRGWKKSDEPVELRSMHPMAWHRIETHSLFSPLNTKKSSKEKVCIWKWTRSPQYTSLQVVVFSKLWTWIWQLPCPNAGELVFFFREALERTLGEQPSHCHTQHWHQRSTSWCCHGGRDAWELAVFPVFFSVKQHTVDGRNPDPTCMKPCE